MAVICVFASHSSLFGPRPHQRSLYKWYILLQTVLSWLSG